MSGGPRSHQVALVAAWVAGVAGTLVRLQHFATRRSLWADEAALAVNIVQRDFRGLLDPLDGNQGAPVLFLWIQRTIVLVGGNNEYALRLVPLVAGIAVLPLVYLLARRLADPVVAASATALVALSPSLIRYSTEVKQYSSDAAVAVGLVLLATWVVDDDTSRRRWLILGAVGAVAVWASHPAVFVLAGVSVVLVVRVATQRGSVSITPLASLGAAWLASLALLYVVSLRRLEQNEFLTDFWAAGFPPRPRQLTDSIRWVLDSAVHAVDSPIGLALPALGLVACLAGVVVLARRDRIGAAMVVGFVPFLLLAAFLERYPVRGRLLLFMVPLALIALAGLTAPWRWRLAGAGVVVVLAAPNLVDVVRSVADPPEFAASRPAFQFVGEHRRDGDEVWIHDVTVEPYRYYGPIVGVSADRRTRWSSEGPCTLDVTGRVWVVFAYTLSTRPPDEADRVRDHLAHSAELLDERRYHDAAVWLFDFPGADAAVPPDLGLGCITTAPEPTVRPSGLSTGPFGTGSTS